MNYDFRSSFENEAGLLNPRPKCTVSFVYHLVHLEQRTMTTLYIMYFKKLANEQAQFMFYSFHLILYPELFKFPAGNRIHLVSLNDYTLLKELFTEMRVDLESCTQRLSTARSHCRH